MCKRTEKFVSKLKEAHQELLVEYYNDNDNVIYNALNSLKQQMRSQ